jgi:hypothetical protein
MFVSSPNLPHIAFSRAIAALDAKQLGWILAHETQITMNLEYEIGVLRLIAGQDPQDFDLRSAAFTARCAERLVALSEPKGVAR